MGTQNAKFDVKFFKFLGIEVNNIVFDTMLAHHLIEENLPHDLEFLASWYTDLGNYDKKLRDVKPNSNASYACIPADILYEYAATDADATYRVFLAEYDYLKNKEKKLFKLLNEQIMPLQDILTEVEYRGVLVDVDLVKRRSAEYQLEIDKLEKEIQDKYTPIYQQLSGTSKVFNPNSPDHLRLVLFSPSPGLGLKPTRYTEKTGKASTDVDTLTALKGQSDLPEKILKIRSLRKFKNTYMEGDTEGTGLLAFVGDDNIVHTTYKIHGTVTGYMRL